MRNLTLQEIETIVNKYPKDMTKEELLKKIHEEPIFLIVGLNEQNVIDYVNENWKN